MEDFLNSFDEHTHAVPAAPISSDDPFHLNEESFDFSISQVIRRDDIPRINARGYLPQTKANESYKTVNESPYLDIVEDSPPAKRQSSFSLNTPSSSQNGKNWKRPEISTPSVLKLPGSTHHNSFNLRSVEEIPVVFRHIFKFPYFNILQSTVFDVVLYTDKSVVISAPTGSGKTAVFEMALVRLLMKMESVEKAKIIYMAPMKALCTERYQEWCSKFQEHGLVSLELTGDSEVDDLAELHHVNLVCTTPEKWDSMSRRWKDKKRLFQDICLFLIDEIHTVNDATRGATVEAVISRMKTLQTVSASMIRFIAVSATLPNYMDIAEWLETPGKPAVAFNIDERHRPVKLERFVIGYPFKEGTSDFRFDMNLSYKLRAVIETHSHGKPTLVFCSSRKSVLQTAEILAKDMRHVLSNRRVDFNLLHRTAMTIHEPKVKEFLQAGIGIHHAGLLMEDRCNIEDLFRLSQLPILVSTSTLAMGVNLPAHLVVIKSTHCYNMGSIMEYSDMQILQMIGRAGRPQFDTSASTVIMTKAKMKNHYQSLVSGTQLVESSLHKHLIEHLNAEIVLQTINDIGLAVEWMRHTFLYVRVIKNAKHYGVPEGLSKEQIEKQLQDLCLRNLNLLTSLNLVAVQEETYEILPTETGRLMARYCIAFETMRLFHSIDAKQDSIADLLTKVSQCAEFDEIQLRTNEKRILNMLNKDKYKETIRFPLPGKIKTRQMKVNCLLQAQLSNLSIHDFSLSQDVSKIFRLGQRVTKCLMELLYQGHQYKLLLHAMLIYKALRSRLWYDSKYVSRQLDGIGVAMSLNFANAGYCTFQQLEQANPREIELIVNRHPPFGTQVKEAIACLPHYELGIDQIARYSCDKATIVVRVDLLNRNKLSDSQTASPTKPHQSLILIGDEDNALIFKWRINDSNILQGGPWTRTINIRRALAGTKLNISLLSLEWVGLDICTEYEPFYSPGWNTPGTKPTTPASKLRAAMTKSKDKGQASQGKDNDAKKRKQLSSGYFHCQHSCVDKACCGHQCCKHDGRGNPVTPPDSTPAAVKQAKIGPYMANTGDRQPHSHRQQEGRPPTPITQEPRITLKKFAYVKPKQLKRPADISKGQHVLESKASTNANDKSLETFDSTSKNSMHTTPSMQQHLVPSRQRADATFQYGHSMDGVSEVDNFMTTKAYTACNVGSLCHDVPEFPTSHSSDEDFCQIPDDFPCHANTPNQKVQARRQPKKDFENVTSHSKSSSPETQWKPSRSYTMSPKHQRHQIAASSHRGRSSPAEHSSHRNKLLPRYTHFQTTSYQRNKSPPAPYPHCQTTTSYQRNKSPPAPYPHCQNNAPSLAQYPSSQHSAASHRSKLLPQYASCQMASSYRTKSSPAPYPYRQNNAPSHRGKPSLDYPCLQTAAPSHWGNLSPRCDLSQSLAPSSQNRNQSLTESPAVISLSSQMSEQFPFPSPSDFREEEEDLSNSSATAQRKPPETETASQSSRTAKSPHRFGLVHAWPRGKTPITCGIKDKIHSSPETEMSHPEKVEDHNKTPTKAKLSSIFVPHHKIPTVTESYVPGKLFEGIFDALF